MQLKFLQKKVIVFFLYNLDDSYICVTRTLIKDGDCIEQAQCLILSYNIIRSFFPLFLLCSVFLGHLCEPQKIRFEENLVSGKYCRTEQINVMREIHLEMKTNLTSDLAKHRRANMDR